MSREYLIDGYNLLHALGLPPGPLGPGGLEKARGRLLDLIAASNREAPAEITVVFDASRPRRKGAAEMDHQGVRVVFAVKHEDADTLIEDLIRAHARPRRLRVVSNDHRVQRAARRRHAQVLSCGQYMDALAAEKKDRDRPAAPDPDAKESQSDADRNYWAREFGDLAHDPTFRELFDTFGTDME